MRVNAALINNLRRLLFARSGPARISSVLALLVLVFYGWQSGWQGDSSRAKPGQLQVGQIVEGEVVAVSDGDTVSLLDADKNQYRVRLAFVDAPEKSQAHGMDAKRHLSDLVYRQQVQLEVIDIDRYDRTVGLLKMGGEEINYRQLAAGYAWHYQRYARDKQSGERFRQYQAAEQSARSEQLGLWREAEPLAPWEYRRQRREN